jgi:hypothetical protein
LRFSFFFHLSFFFNNFTRVIIAFDFSENYARGFEIILDN